MNVYEFKISKEALQEMQKLDREYLLWLCHFYNEVSILLKLILVSAKSKFTEKIEIYGDLTMRFFYIKTLVGILIEGKNNLESEIIPQYRDAIDSEGNTFLKELNKFFSNENYFHGIRNQLAFHYNRERIADGLQIVNEDLMFYAEKGGRSNNLYYFAEVVANFALLKLIDTDPRKAIEKLTNDTMQVAGWMLDYNDLLIAAIFKKYPDKLWIGNEKEIDLSRIKKFDDISLPWFFEIPDLVTD